MELDINGNDIKGEYYPINMIQAEAIKAGAKHIEILDDPAFKVGRRIILKEPGSQGGWVIIEITAVIHKEAKNGYVILGIEVVPD